MVGGGGTAGRARLLVRPRGAVLVVGARRRVVRSVLARLRVVRAVRAGLGVIPGIGGLRAGRARGAVRVVVVGLAVLVVVVDGDVPGAAAPPVASVGRRGAGREAYAEAHEPVRRWGRSRV